MGVPKANCQAISTGTELSLIITETSEVVHCLYPFHGCRNGNRLLKKL